MVKKVEKPKNYLNTEERGKVIMLIHLLANSKSLLEKNTLSKDEKKHLRASLSFLKSTIKLIKVRLNEDAFKALMKEVDNSKMYIDSYKVATEFAKKKSNDIGAAYEENREYFRLIELIMHTNCNKCNKKCEECDFYSEFEENHIPELSGYENYGQCKYAYDRDLTKGDEKNES